MTDQTSSLKTGDAILFAFATLLPVVGTHWSFGWLVGSGVHSLRLDYESQLALLFVLAISYLFLILVGVRFSKTSGDKVLSGFLLASLSSGPLLFASGFLPSVIFEEFGGYTSSISSVVAFVGAVLFFKEVYFWKLGLSKDSS